MDAALQIEPDFTPAVSPRPMRRISPLEEYQLLLRLNPADAASWLQMGADLQRAQFLDQAVVCLQRAMRIDPANADIWSQQALLWLDVGQPVQALRAAKQAVRCAPERTETRVLLARVLREIGQHDEAQRLLEDCLLGEPCRRDALHELALNFLQVGDYRRGWQSLYAREQPRLISQGALRSSPWRGQQIGGKRVLLIAETDHCETLWALRYLRQLILRGADLHLACAEPIHSVLQELPIRIWRETDPALQRYRFDFHCALLDIPVLMDQCRLSLPEPAALHVPDASRTRIQHSIANLPVGLKVGIAWTDQHFGPDTAQRAVSMQRLLSMAHHRGVHLFSLQTGPGAIPEGVRDRVTGVQDLAACIHDTGSLAAAVQAMDVVVTTDNEVAHLAGALNTPGLVLLRHNPHWIYGKHRDAMPSYATLRLIRQPEAGDWRTPCKEAERLIAAWAATRLRQGA